MSFVRYLDEMVAAMGVEGARSFVNQHLNTLTTRDFFGAAFQSSFTPSSSAAGGAAAPLPEATAAPATAATEVGGGGEKESEGSVSEGSSEGKKQHRKFKYLSEIFAVGTKFYLQSLGDRWDVELGVSDKNQLIFKMGEQVYTSPSALCKAHASRITQNHPSPTAPGLPWKYIRVAEGPDAGTSIGPIYDTHFSSA